MQLAEIEKHLLTVASQTLRIKLAEDIVPQLKTLLQDSETTATGCFYAAVRLCGDQFRGWEPESLWLTLDRRGVNVPLVNRDKLLAAATLTLVPAFWWEVNAFENTVLAFNNVLSNPQIMQEATPEQLTWAIYEAEVLYKQQDDFIEAPEFDREPIIYTATVLQRNGFILAPELLSFAQASLDKLNRNGSLTNKTVVQQAWNKLKAQDLTQTSFKDTALDIQLARLTNVQLYVAQRLVRYKDDLMHVKA